MLMRKPLYVRQTHVRETETRVCQTECRPISCQSTLDAAAIGPEVKWSSPHAPIGTSSQLPPE